MWSVMVVAIGTGPGVVTEETVMPSYLLSVFAPADTAAAGGFGPYPDEETMRTALRDTDEFNERLRREGRLVLADGLDPAAAARVVDGQGASPVVTEGPYLETTEHLGGFWVIEAADLDEATRIAGDASRACRGAVEVRAFAAPPGA